MRFLKKIGFVLLAAILGIAATYLLGPKPKFEAVNAFTPAIKLPVNELDSLVTAREKAINDIKPNNEARIVWANNKKEKTNYALVYLHGFSASQMEAHPIHHAFAKRYGMNLYLSRLEQHGRIDTNAFVGITPDALFESAQQALAIGKKLGDKVILMSCSTGGTLSIMLAKTNPEIHSFIMYSPNIDIKDPMSTLVTEQWGSELTSLVVGGDYNKVPYSDEIKKYWYSVYHIDGIIMVKSLIKTYMNDENFNKITQPLFMGYYRKSEEEQDQVVSVPRMLEFYDKIATPEKNKRKVNFTSASRHVICSSLMNPNYMDVEKETYKFAEEILGLKPIE